MAEKVDRLNLRVYGILINDDQEVLLSHEHKGSIHFSKFPGGGLEFGEGTHDCLIREYREEVGIHIQINRHWYTTEFFQQSAFNERDQLMSIYYLVSSEEAQQIINGQKAIDPEADPRDYFSWKKIEDLSTDDVTYPIDKKVVELIRSRLLQS